MSSLTYQPDEDDANDTFIDSYTTTTNWGTDARIYAGLASAKGGTVGYRSLIHIPKSGIAAMPRNAHVYNAYMTLAEHNVGDVPQKLVVGEVRVSADAVRYGFEETRTNWEDYQVGSKWSQDGMAEGPGKDYTLKGNMDDYKKVPDGDGSTDYDITPIARRRAKNTRTLSMVFVQDGATAMDAAHSFKSSTDGTAGNRPKLTLEYTAPRRNRDSSRYVHGRPGHAR